MYIWFCAVLTLCVCVALHKAIRTVWITVTSIHPLLLPAERKPHRPINPSIVFFPFLLRCIHSPAYQSFRSPRVDVSTVTAQQPVKLYLWNLSKGGINLGLDLSTEISRNLTESTALRTHQWALNCITFYFIFSRK